MTTTESPKTFWASVDDKRFLQKVDRVFDASPKTVWVELLQNARRAKATEVTVELSQFENAPEKDQSLHVVFRDNGEGLDNPAPLLTLASKGWSDETEAAEDPAGMGFFCLSNFKAVVVRSKDWTALFTPPVFRMEEGVTQEKAISYVCGFEVRMAWDDVHLVNVANALRDAARFCQLEKVTIKKNGETAEVIVPEDFLKNSEVPVREVPELGVRIGCVTRHDSYRYRPCVELNFRGVGIVWDTSGELGDHLSNITDARLLLKVEVQHTRELQLVLPARNAVKHTPGRLALLEELERSAYEWLRRKGQEKDSWSKHTLPFSVYLRAKEKFGIDIGEARCALSNYAGRMGDDRNLDKILAGRDLQDWDQLPHIVEQYNSAQAKTKKPGYLSLLREDDKMVGYSWYDAMPRLLKVVPSVDGVGLPYESMSQPQPHDAGKATHIWVNRALVEMHISDERVLEVEPPALIVNEGTYRQFDEALADAFLYLPEAIKSDMKALLRVVSELNIVLFDNECSESYNEGEVEVLDREFDRDATAWLLEMTGQDKQAKLHLMKEYIRGMDWGARDKEMVWTLRFDGRKKDSDRNIELVSLQYTKEEDTNHKLLCGMPCGEDSWVEEIVSDKPITPDRIEAYLKKEHGFGTEDSWALDNVGQAVNLDEWEKKNLKSKTKRTSKTK